MPLSSLTLGATIEEAAPLLFYAMAGLSILSAWAIVLSRSIVRMALYLLLTLVGVAGLYFMMEAEFLAAIQMIVYAGGTLVLIIFGVMLTSRNPFAELTIRPWERVVGPLISAAIGGLLLLALVTSSDAIQTTAGRPEPTQAPIYLVGEALLSTYIVPFEVAAVLLLVVMIGAAYMARRRMQA